MEENDILSKDLYNIQNSNVTKIVGIRRSGSCIIKGIPEKTSVDDLYLFLNELITGITIKNINIYYPNSPKKQLRTNLNGVAETFEIFCLQAFLTFEKDEDCKRLVEFFQDSTISNEGFYMVNDSGISGNLFVHFLYTKEDDDFYIKKMLNVDDINKLQKKERTVIFYRVPEKTTVEEFSSFIAKNIPNISGIIDVEFRSPPVFSKNLKAIVELQSNEDCDNIVKYFKYYNGCGEGFSFKNEAGVESGLLASYFYLKDTKDRKKVNNEVILHNVPSDTSKKEIYHLLNDVCPETKNFQLKINITQSNTMFVWLGDNSCCDKVVSCFCNGYKFTNSLGSNSKIYADYCLERNFVFDIQRVCYKLQNKGMADKELNKLIIYNVPAGATDDEVLLFIAMIDPDVNIDKVLIDSNFNSSYFYAIVSFKSEDDCKKIADFFAPYIDYKRGYEFETFSGEKSEVVVAYAYRKDVVKKQNMMKKKNNGCTISPRLIVQEIMQKQYEEQQELGIRINSLRSLVKPGVINGIADKVEKGEFKSILETEGEMKPDEIVVHGIPVTTKVEELKQVLEGSIPNLNELKNVMFRRNKFGQFSAFVEVDPDGRERIKSFLSNGFKFKNENGQNGTLTAQYYFTKQKDVNVKKQTDRFYLYNVPEKTTHSELCQYLKSTFEMNAIQAVKISENNNSKLSASVIINEEVVEVIDYINQINKHDLCFKNGEGFEEQLSAQYHFVFSNPNATNDQLVVQNVPRDTENTEIESLLKGITPSIVSVITSVQVNDPMKKYFKTEENMEKSPMMAYITMASKNDCDDILKYFSEFEKGYHFTNKKGSSGYLVVNPFSKSKPPLLSSNANNSRQLTVFNLPVKTTKEAMVTFLFDMIDFIACLQSISIQNKTAFLKLSAIDCDKIMWYLYRNNLVNGFSFTNQDGCSSRIVIKHSGKTCSNTTKPMSSSQLNVKSNDIRTEEIVLYNLPDGSDKEDVVDLMQKTTKIGSFQQIRLFYPTCNRKVYIDNQPVSWCRLKAFIRFDSVQECDFAYEYFKKHPVGVWFQNRKEYSSHVCVEHVYENYAKNTEEKEHMNILAEVVEKNSIPENKENLLPDSKNVLELQEKVLKITSEKYDLFSHIKSINLKN